MARGEWRRNDVYAWALIPRHEPCLLGLCCAWDSETGKPSVFPFLPPTGKSRFPTPSDSDPRKNALRLFCAWDQNRTGDPSLFRGMLYQLSYPSPYTKFAIVSHCLTMESVVLTLTNDVCVHHLKIRNKCNYGKIGVGASVSALPLSPAHFYSDVEVETPEEGAYRKLDIFLTI